MDFFFKSLSTNTSLHGFNFPLLNFVARCGPNAPGPPVSAFDLHLVPMATDTSCSVPASLALYSEGLKDLSQDHRGSCNHGACLQFYLGPRTIFGPSRRSWWRHFSIISPDQTLRGVRPDNSPNRTVTNELKLLFTPSARCQEMRLARPADNT